MRPNTADTSCAETAASDSGGTAKERITRFSLFAETTRGRTRGWSVICGYINEMYPGKEKRRGANEPKESGNRAGSWGL